MRPFRVLVVAAALAGAAVPGAPASARPRSVALPLTAAAPVALTVAADGRPWVMAGGALWRLRGRRWEASPSPVAPAAGSEILGLPDGRLVVASAEGVALWDPATGTAMPVAGAPAPLRGLRLAPDGTVWALQGDPATVVHIDPIGDSATLHGVPADMADVTALAVAADGRVLLGTRGPSAVHVADFATATIVCRLVPGGGEPSSLAADGAGRLHVALRGPAGLAAWDVPAGPQGVADVAPPRAMRALLVASDPAGAAWAVTRRQVVRLDRVAAPVALPERALMVAASPRGGLWIAGRTRLVRVR